MDKIYYLERDRVEVVRDCKLVANVTRDKDSDTYSESGAITTSFLLMCDACDRVRIKYVR